MANGKPDDPESTVEQHVREILARLSALKARLRAQDTGSGDNTVKVDREDDRPSGIDGVKPPS